MEIPLHTQQAIAKQDDSHLFARYNQLDVTYSSRPETYFEGHYDQETGHHIHTSGSIRVNGLRNPTDNSAPQDITLEKRTYRGSARLSGGIAVRYHGHEMFRVWEDGVQPPECTELARFIIENIEKR